jgi:GNAT superfamily N-acetyltransferase
MRPRRRRGRGSIKQLRLDNPALFDLLLAYRADPSLSGWWEIRTKALIPGSLRSGTVWTAVMRLAWTESGKPGKVPTLDWSEKDPRAYADKHGAFPPPAEVERAVRSALGLSSLASAGVGGVGPMQDAGVPLELPSLPFTPPKGVVLPLYRGGGRRTNQFWESAGDIGVSVLMLKKDTKSPWMIFLGQRPGKLEILTERIDPLSSTTRTVGGPDVQDAVYELGRRGLFVRLDDSMEWEQRGDEEKARLVPKKVRARKPKSTCTVVSIAEDSEHEHLAWDRTDELFSQGGINQASYEEPLFACVEDLGGAEHVLGVAVGGLITTRGILNDEMSEFRFSVAVDPKARRRGVARALVRAIKDHWAAEQAIWREAFGVEGVGLTAWVVNPHMVDLLESEGFSPDGSWSADNPFMYFWG